jgi:hypothetical protein
MKYLRSVGLLLFLLAAAVASRANTYNNLASFQAATSNLTYINFDTLPDGSPAPGSGDIRNAYSAWGISFAPGNMFESHFFRTVSPPNGWLSNNGYPNPVFQASFLVGNITAVGVFNALFGGTPNGSLLQAYDSSNNLLGSVLSDTDPFTMDFFGLTTSSPIATFTITVPNATGWGLDDLYYGQAVPEPSGLIMTGSGVLVLVAVLRCKMRL